MPALGRCLASLLRCTVTLEMVGLSRGAGALAGPRQLHPALGIFLLPPVGTHPSARDSAFAHGMRISAKLPPTSAARDVHSYLLLPPRGVGSPSLTSLGPKHRERVSPLSRDLQVQGLWDHGRGLSVQECS